MRSELHAELRKLRLTRSLWAIPVAGAALFTVVSALVISLMKPDELAERLSEHGPLRFGPTNVGLLLLVLGIRLFADETHHRTLASTYVAAPRRRRVLGAKLSTAAALAVAYCAVTFALIVPITLIGAGVRDLPLDSDLTATMGLFARTTFAMALTGVIGVALGALGRNRAVVLVGSLAWLSLGENLAGALLKIPELLPGATIRAIVSGADGPDALSALGARALLLAFAVVATVAAMTRLDDDVV
jgi:ABC-2 type transport system permease protein